MMQVADGMVVHTKSAKVVAAQKAVMEFLLINHPLDCPICDQAGECKLQDHAVEYGPGKSRYTEPKLALAKAVDIGTHVMLDQERCIHCSRCIRFCDEVSKTGELGFFKRGASTVIGTWPGKRLDNPYSGCTVDICPVGALTLKEFRFKTRVWYLKNTPSVCIGCARGCNVVVATGRQREMFTTLGQQDDRVKRLTPRANPEVNGHWMCDEGRLSFKRLDAVPALESVDYENTIGEVAKALRRTGARIGLVVSPRVTSETMWVWKRLAADHLGAVVGVHRVERGADDALLLRRDKGANSTGAAWIFGAAQSAANVVEAARRGSLDVLVVLGDVLDPADVPPVPAEVASGLRALVYVGPFADETARHASLLLPAAAWTEEDGTVVNFEGRIQAVRRARVPRSEVRPGWRIAADVAAAAGLALPHFTSSADVLADLAAGVAAFAGASPESVGLLGRPGAVAATAGR
jgi:NADH-quinone oxidoreductase subunit G